jgi:hypothetical protein
MTIAGEHYHLGNHQGLDNRLIMGTPVADAPACVGARALDDC